VTLESKTQKSRAADSIGLWLTFRAPCAAARRYSPPPELCQELTTFAFANPDGSYVLVLTKSGRGMRNQLPVPGEIPAFEAGAQFHRHASLELGWVLAKPAIRSAFRDFYCP